MRQDQGFDFRRATLHCLSQYRGRGSHRHALAVLAPASIQNRVAVGRERSLAAFKAAPIGRVAQASQASGTTIEVPPRLRQQELAQRRCELCPRGLLEPSWNVGQVRWNHDANRPRGEALKERRVPLQEVAELVTQQTKTTWPDG